MIFKEIIFTTNRLHWSRFMQKRGTYLYSLWQLNLNNRVFEHYILNIFFTYLHFLAKLGPIYLWLSIRGIATSQYMSVLTSTWLKHLSFPFQSSVRSCPHIASVTQSQHDEIASDVGWYITHYVLAIDLTIRKALLIDYGNEYRFFQISK